MGRRSFAAALLSLATLMSASAPAPAEEPAAEPIRGIVDHVLVSLPSAHFAALDAHLTEHLQGGWFGLPEQGKGFIVTQDRFGYVEIWDAGRAVFNWPLGSQIAITTEDTDRGRAVAEAHYATPGRTWDAAGMADLLTVCPGDMADPLGGTFFVAYGPGVPLPVNPASPITTLEEVVTVIPDTRTANNEAYRVFGFAEEKVGDGVVFTGAKGTRARVIPRDFFEITLPGHALLTFRLAEPVAEKRVESIVEGSIMAIHDGDTMTIVLSPDGVAMVAPAVAAAPAGE